MPPSALSHLSPTAPASSSRLSTSASDSFLVDPTHTSATHSSLPSRLTPSSSRSSPTLPNTASSCSSSTSASSSFLMNPAPTSSSSRCSLPKKGEQPPTLATTRTSVTPSAATLDSTFSSVSHPQKTAASSSSSAKVTPPPTVHASLPVAVCAFPSFSSCADKVSMAEQGLASQPVVSSMPSSSLRYLAPALSSSTSLHCTSLEGGEQPTRSPATKLASTTMAPSTSSTTSTGLLSVASLSSHPFGTVMHGSLTQSFLPPSTAMVDMRTTATTSTTPSWPSSHVATPGHFTWATTTSPPSLAAASMPSSASPHVIASLLACKVGVMGFALNRWSTLLHLL